MSAVITNPGVSRPCLYGRCGQCVAPDTCGCGCGHPTLDLSSQPEPPRPVGSWKVGLEQHAAEWIAGMSPGAPGETAAAVRAARTERT